MMSTTPPTKQSPQPLTASNEVIVAVLAESVWKNSRLPAPVIPLKDLQAFTQQAEHPGFHVYAHEDCYQVLTAEQMERTSKFFTRNAVATFAMARDKAAKEGEELTHGFLEKLAERPPPPVERHPPPPEEELIKRGLTTAEELLNRLHTGLPEHSEPPEHFPPISSFIMRTAGEPTAARLQWLHAAWERAREENLKLPHPLAPIIRSYIEHHYQYYKKIDPGYDARHPVAILDPGSLGSIRDVVIPAAGDVSDLVNLKGISAPKTEQLIIEEITGTSKLPQLLPLETFRFDGMATTKRGAVAMVIRLFFEAMMALGPKETKATLHFELGNMLKALNPKPEPTDKNPNPRRYNRTLHLPYLLRGLESLFYIRIPFRGHGVDWIPVKPLTVPNADADDKSPILLEVNLPPNAIGGMLVEKDVLRITGKKSSARFNGYLTACGIFDRYGTFTGKKKGIIDPTRPTETRDADGNLIDASGQVIFDSRGNPHRKVYHTNTIAKLDRERNPNADKYPVLSIDDLVRACFPKGFPREQFAKYLMRAKKAWGALEADGFVRIERHRHGWRIMPSESHVKRHRAINSKH